jgi:hypothetical protein
LIKNSISSLYLKYIYFATLLSHVKSWLAKIYKILYGHGMKDEKFQTETPTELQRVDAFRDIVKQLFETIVADLKAGEIELSLESLKAHREKYRGILSQYWMYLEEEPEDRKETELRRIGLDLGLDFAGPQSPIKHLMEAASGWRLNSGHQINLMQRGLLASAGVISASGYLGLALGIVAAFTADESLEKTAYALTGLGGLFGTGAGSMVPWAAAVSPDFVRVVRITGDNIFDALEERAPKVAEGFKGWLWPCVAYPAIGFLRVMPGHEEEVEVLRQTLRAKDA